MRKFKISSKGQVTIPQRFRQQMHLTEHREVEMEQLTDGSVVIRPVKSVLHLAGQLRPGTRPLTAKQERAAARRAMAKRHRPKGGK
jgi:AbrB family looped-hinge helix DNA binding protein